jgi:hypothetical protein
MKLRDEMIERMKAAPQFASSENAFTGWTIHSDDWSGTTQAAVDIVMTYTNALMEMVLRLAEAIDVLRDSMDIEGDQNGG